MAAVAAGLGLAAAGCSAGQVTQTDTQVAAVNGASGGAGPIAVRDAQLLFPAAHGYYQPGEDAPVVVLIANNGTEADKLLSVTADGAGDAEITGDVDLEAGTAITAGEKEAAGHASSHATTTTTAPSSASASASPVAPTSTGSATSGSSAATTTTTSASDTSISAPATTSASAKVSASREPSAEPGKVSIVLKGLKGEVRPGQTVKVTFLFEKAGPVTLELPIGATSKPRDEGKSEH